MTKLVVIADDLTGAMDTGVQFSKKQISTAVLLDAHADMYPYRNCEVLVYDVESRHRKPEEAAELVKTVAECAKKNHVPFLYKKTDSALRGNIGAELEAAVNVYGGPLCFVPAFPGNGRTTRGGIQYVKDIPVAQSVFGEDPFEPVTESGVAAIIGQQSGISVRKYGLPENGGGYVDGQEERAERIDIYDAVSNADLEEISLRRGAAYSVFAGCAGFAEYLDRVIPFSGGEPAHVQKGTAMCVISGSLNAVTRRQLKAFHEKADGWMTFSDRQLFDETYSESPEAKSFIADVSGKKRCVLFTEKSETEGKFEAQTKKDDRRRCVSENIGKIAAELINATDADCIPVIIGGDTLYGLIIRLKAAVQPVTEIEPGVVVAKITAAGKDRLLVTKAGGLGSDTVLLDVMNTMLK